MSASRGSICGGDAELAEDAVQAAWPIAWRKLHTLRDPDRLRPWLVSVAANEARGLVRRRRPIVALELADISTEQDDRARNAWALDVRAAIRRLPADDRTILALRGHLVRSRDIDRPLTPVRSGAGTPPLEDDPR